VGRRCGGEGAAVGRVAGEGARSAPAGRARGCRAVRAERGPARRAGVGSRGRSAARKPGSSAAPEPLQLCSKLGPAAAPRFAGSRSSPAPTTSTTTSVASTWLETCSPGRRQAAAAPPRDSSEQASLQPTARRLRAVVPSFPGSGLPGQSIAPPQWPAQEPGKPLAAHARRRAQPRTAPFSHWGYRFPQRPGVCSRPSRSPKGHESLESGWMLKAAALSCRPQPLSSQSPASSEAAFRRLFSPPAVTPVLSLLKAWPPPPVRPHFPLSSFPSAFHTSSFPKFLLHSNPLSPACFSSQTALPSLSAFPPRTPPPSLSVDPSLCNSSPICFSSAQPRPVTSFLYLSPDSPCLSSPPTASLIPGPDG